VRNVPARYNGLLTNSKERYKEQKESSVLPSVTASVLMEFVERNPDGKLPELMRCVKDWARKK